VCRDDHNPWGIEGTASADLLILDDYTKAEIVKAHRQNIGFNMVAVNKNMASVPPDLVVGKLERKRMSVS
jgi:hypothetical protein